MERHKYYQITVSSDNSTADIIIYGTITSFATDLARWYDSDENIAEVSARQIIKEINDLNVSTINVYINSYGGEVAEALAIYTALKRHSASVHTYCDGFACSAATIIFCAGDVRTMGSIALMMIHNCMSYIGYANSEELRKAAEDNDKINQASIEAYKKVSNLPEDQIKTMMSAETWLTAQECLDYGFATEIADMDDDQTVQQSAFRQVRDAVLSAQNQTGMDGIMQRLDEIQEQINGLSKPNVPKENEKPEAPVAPAQMKAKAFFEKMFTTKEE